MKTNINKPVWGDWLELWFYERRVGGGISVSSNLVMENVEEGMPIHSEPIRLKNIEAQELMDQLWQAGLRPSEGSGSAGSLAATERHLADMRTLVFKKVDQ